jgi:two-component system sensor histidine kinase KdpD
MSSFELTEAATWAGRPVARQVTDARSRTRVVVTGTIRAAQAVTRGTRPAYCCTLDDGTGQLDLLFLGRTAIPGLTVGTRCSVEGTTRTEGNRMVVWNPLYRLEVLTSITEDSPAARATVAAPPVPAAEPAPLTTPRDSATETVVELTDTGGEGDSDIVEAAGHFRIYLGAAAGVGKTVAMLDEARRRRQRGADVAIGIVESHGRPVTEEHMTGLEVVPLRTVEYRGVTFHEMDLDAVLRRHPKVALVDELAHTNVPGSGRHDKRWQDVLELLEAGIDVITTVNIQHLESIADAVERITDVQVRERVPDWVVRRADQIELVDSSPEQLRRRMVHGNIYPPDKVPQALTHFFRVDNLTALRELALRFLADETEGELMERLRRYQTDVVWETAERIMVGVTTAPGTDAIVRRASRMAARIKADLHVVHVNSGDTSRRTGGGRLDQLRQVASDVGATWNELDADDTVEALIDFARHQQITQIVIGSSQRSRWQEMIGGGSIVKRVSRRAAGVSVDVHIIARRHTAVDSRSDEHPGTKHGAATPQAHEGQ